MPAGGFQIWGSKFIRIETNTNLNFYPIEKLVIKTEYNATYGTYKSIMIDVDGSMILGASTETEAINYGFSGLQDMCNTIVNQLQNI